jgi:hypothetical protein
MIWTPPVFSNSEDPWIDGISLTTLRATAEQTLGLTADLQVVVSTEPRAQPVSKRTMSAEINNHGTLRLNRVFVVAAIVDVSSQPQQTLADSTIAELSLPYDAMAIAPGTNLRMVKFHQPKGRWVDVGDQSVNVSKHLVTARVPAVGRFTLVAELPPSDLDLDIGSSQGDKWVREPLDK